MKAFRGAPRLARPSESLEIRLASKLSIRVSRLSEGC